MSEKDVKSLIVQSATGFFSKFGYAKTTMDEIARHIHKGKGVLYYYFRSKEDLFKEVLRQELQQVKDELNKHVTSDEDSLVILKNYFFTRLRLLRNAFNYHETLKADFFESFHFVNDVREDFIEFERAQLTIILTKSKEQGYISLKDIQTSVNVILMVAYSVEIPLYLQNRYDEYEETILELANMIVNNLRHNKIEA